MAKLFRLFESTRGPTWLKRFILKVFSALSSLCLSILALTASSWALVLFGLKIRFFCVYFTATLSVSYSSIRFSFSSAPTVP